LYPKILKINYNFIVLQSGTGISNTSANGGAENPNFYFIQPHVGRSGITWNVYRNFYLNQAGVTFRRTSEVGVVKYSNGEESCTNAASSSYAGNTNNSSWFNTSSGFSYLYWSSSNMRRNAGGNMPLPAAFAYQVELGKSTTDYNLIKSCNSNYSVTSRTSNDMRYYSLSNGYFEKGQSLSVTNEESTYYLCVNGSRVLSYTLTDHSRKVDGDIINAPTSITLVEGRRTTAEDRKTIASINYDVLRSYELNNITKQFFY